jgi:CRP-like cAMP-binding protein
MDILSPFALEALGLIGVAFYLGSYATLQLGLIDGQSNTYAVLNIIAASLVLVSLGQAFNLSSAIIQVSWIIISLIGICRVFILTKRARFSDEEQQLLDDKFPKLVPHLARELLNRGIWINGQPGTELSREGEVVSGLTYLVSGEASVAVDDKMVGRVPLYSFVGELTIMTDEPATATVMLTSESRYFYLKSEGLRQLASRDTRVKVALSNSFIADSKDKQIRRNSEYIESIEVSSQA